LTLARRAKAGHALPIGGEFLDAGVAPIGNIHITLGVHPHPPGGIELAGAPAGPPPPPNVPAPPPQPPAPPLLFFPPAPLTATPQGRLTWPSRVPASPHCRMYVPSVVNFWTRWLFWSTTYT